MYTDNKATPLISAFDPFVLPVKYLSFGSYQGAQVEYLYNCVSDKTTPETDAKNEQVAEPSDELSKVSLDGWFTIFPFAIFIYIIKNSFIQSK